MIKKKKRQASEVNASSMADIAFLLLIFFLVTTTIASEKGIPQRLPPIYEDENSPKVEVNARNLFVIIINSKNELLVEDMVTQLDQVTPLVKKFVSNFGQDKDLSDSPQKAIVSIKNDRDTNYDTYLRVINAVHKGYDELRAKKLRIAPEKYIAFVEEVQEIKKNIKREEELGRTYELSDAEKDKMKRFEEVRKYYPKQITEPNPSSVNGN